MSATDSSASLESGSWRLDPADSAVEFVTRTTWGLTAVKGSFSKYEGRLDLSATPAIELVIDATTLDTRNAKRDEHLRSGDFFGVEATPEVRFEASEVEVHGDHLHVSGTLTAGGKSLAIEPSAHLHALDGGYELHAEAVIKHGDLGMTANPMGMIRPTSRLIVRGKLVQG